MKSYKLHLLSEAQDISFGIFSTALSKKDKRFIKRISPLEYPDPIPEPIGWQNYINNISNDQRITDYAHWISTFVGSQPFKQLQIQKYTSQKSNHKSTSDLNYKHLADYAGFLFICLFNQWSTEETAKAKADAENKVKAFKEYYRIEKENGKNPYIKTEAAFTIKEGVHWTLQFLDGELQIALPSVTINDLVVKKYSDKQPIPFDQEGSKRHFHSIAIDGNTKQAILKKRLSPFIEIYESPFTLCILRRWEKNINVPLNVEYFAGALYTYAVQYCTNIIKTRMDLLIEITAHFSEMNGHSLSKNVIRKQFEEFKAMRETPDRKDHNYTFLQAVYHNTVDKYYDLFYGAFRDWKLDLLHRQGTIETKYYFGITSGEDLIKLFHKYYHDPDIYLKLIEVLKQRLIHLQNDA